MTAFEASSPDEAFAAYSEAAELGATPFALAGLGFTALLCQKYETAVVAL
jgi:hypothetical protein